MSISLRWLLTILVVAAGIQFSRFLPLLFLKNRRIPPIIDEFGKVIPSAMMGLLVVYALKGVKTDLSLFWPSLIASLTVIFIHLWKREILLSIAVGTIVYMLLLNLF